MNPDLLSVVVRTLALAGVLQAAGAAFFVVLFGPWLLRSGQRIRRLGYQAALAGMEGGQAAAVGVDRQLAAEPDPAALDERAWPTAMPAWSIRHCSDWPGAAAAVRPRGCSSPDWP